MAKLQHSTRAVSNMTSQIKAQWKFLQSDLKHEKIALAKAKTFSKYDLPGVKTMIARHESGVKKTQKDIEGLKKRITKLVKEGKINKFPLK